MGFRKYFEVVFNRICVWIGMCVKEKIKDYFKGFGLSNWRDRVVIF